MRWIAPAPCRRWPAPDRTLYRFDVRTPEEYAAGHLPGFASAPGGQLVQETDLRAPVRGARIVLPTTTACARRMSRLVAGADGLGRLRGRDGGFDGGAGDRRLAAGRPADPDGRDRSAPTTWPWRWATAPWWCWTSPPSPGLSQGPHPRRLVHHPRPPGRGLRAHPRGPADRPDLARRPLARLAAAEVEEISDHPVRVLDGGTRPGRRPAAGWTPTWSAPPPIPRTSTSAPMRVPTTPPRPCRPISTGSCISWPSSPTMASAISTSCRA